MPKLFYMCMILQLLTVISCERKIDSSNAIKKSDKVDSKVGNVSNKKNVNAPKKNLIFNINKDEYLLGNEGALIPIHVFVDYGCATCARIDRVLRRLMTDKEFQKIVNVNYHHYPRTALSVKPAKIALAAGQQGKDKFWLMSEKLFAADGELANPDYLQWAQEIGLNVTQFTRDLLENDQKFTERMEQTRKIAVNIKNAGSALGVFIGGYLYRGPMVLENIKSFIMRAKNYNERLITPHPLKNDASIK